MTARKMTVPGSESMTETLSDGTHTENVITAGESAAALTVAVVVGVRTALVTGTESGTAANHDLAHRVALEAEAEVRNHFTIVIYTLI